MTTDTLEASGITIQTHTVKTRLRRIPVITVNECITQWCDWLRKHAAARTYDSYSSAARNWAAQMKLGGKDIVKVDEDDISKWINSDSKTKRSSRTLYLSIIRSLFRFLVIKAIIRPDPSRLVRINYGILDHEQKESREVLLFSDHQFATLILHLDTEITALRPLIEKYTIPRVVQKLLARRSRLLFWKCATVISRCTGLRLGDVCQLEWACFKDGKFAVWTDKRNKRVEPHIWNRPLFDEITAMLPADDAQYVFPDQRKMILNANRRSGLSTTFTKLCQRVNLGGRSFHSLRHTYATECRKAGIPTPHIASSLGHSSTLTTEGYIHEL